MAELSGAPQIDRRQLLRITAVAGASLVIGGGLGLPTVHRIIEEHGGSIRMERSSEKWSTVMRIRLPGAGGPA